MKKNWIKWICLCFSVHYGAITVNDMLDIHK